MQQIYQYRSDHEISYCDMDVTINKITQDVIRSIAQSSNSTNMKAITKDLRKHKEFSKMQSSITNSVGVKLRRFLSEKSYKTEKKIFLNLQNFSSLMQFAMSFLPAVEYYIEGSLLLAYYNASQTFIGIKEGFSLSPYFEGLFYFNLCIMSFAYLCSVTLGFMLMPIKANSYKVFFILARLISPIYIPFLKAVKKIKGMFCKDPTFEMYQKNILMDREYAKIRCRLLIPKTCVENIPQLIFALLFFFSDPLKESVMNDSNSPFKSLKELAIINLAKSLLSWILVSNSFATYLHILKNFSVGAVGRVLVALSNLAFMMSRISGIIFCLIFSTCYPDLQFYLFYLSQSRTFTLRSSIPSNVIEELYQATLSVAPALFVVITMGVLPLVNALAFKLLVQPKLVKLLPMPEIILTSIINMFCPFEPNVTLKGNTSRMDKIKLNLICHSVFFVVNVTFITFPLMWYGSHFFDTTIPILDELCRYFFFIRSNEFPSTFPKFMPVHIFNSHIIFPIVSLGTFICGLFLSLLYRYNFHPRKAITSSVIMSATTELDLNVFDNGQFLPSEEN